MPQEKDTGDSQSSRSELSVPAMRNGRLPAEYVPTSEFDGYGPGNGKGPTGTPIAPLMLRHKWLAMFLAAAILAIGLPCIWFLLPPQYRSTAVVRISPAVDPLVFATEKSRVVPFYQEFVNTEVSVIRSPTVLERVLDRPELRQTEWYKQANKGAQAGSLELTQTLLESLDVQPRRGTQLIDVAVSAPRPHDSKLISDAVVSEYIKFKEEMERASSTQHLETLTTEQSELQNEIDGLIQTRFNISKRLGTTTPEELRSQLSQRYNALEADIKEKQRQLEMTRWEMKIVATSQTQPAESGATDRRYAADGTWRQLYMAAETARHEADLAAQQYGKLHPAVKRARSNVEYAERQLKAYEAQLAQTYQITPNQASGDEVLRVSREGLQFHGRKQEEELRLLQMELDRQRSKLNEASDVALELAKYDEFIRQKRELYEAVRSKREQLEMEEKAPTRVRLVASALEPTRPDNDRRLLLTAAAIVAALGAGLGGSYLRGSTDKRIHNAGELQHMVQVPFLGLLPKLPSSSVPGELGGALAKLPANGGINPRLMLIENMRMIRTTLLERVSRTGEQVVLITSSLPSTGKTSVAVLLAQSLAMVGKKVLLVEADLRRPVLGSRLGLKPAQGLAALLAGRAGDDQSVVRGPGGRFDVVLAGNLPDDFNPELMANGVFSACLSRWRKKYDFVLLDSPPLLRVADSQILAGHADGTIMVLRSSHDRRAEAMQAFAQLSASGGVLLGTVLIGGDLDRDYGRDGDYSSASVYRSEPILTASEGAGNNGNQG